MINMYICDYNSLLFITEFRRSVFKFYTMPFCTKKYVKDIQFINAFFIFYRIKNK